MSTLEQFHEKVQSLCNQIDECYKRLSVFDHSHEQGLALNFMATIGRTARSIIDQQKQETTQHDDKQLSLDFELPSSASTSGNVPDAGRTE